MKFKIDENLPAEIADILKSASYDAISVTDQGMKGVNDDTVIDVCSKEGRILVSLDLDFADIFAYPPKQYAGIMVIRVGIQEKYHIIDTFRRVIPLIGHETINQRLWIIEEGRVRIRG